ncbi:MAG: hypothetical protein KF752_09190 [Pirellulaceae bacterium]|nr:hypothetical protein [Pirellulaceae bacterium]
MQQLANWLWVFSRTWTGAAWVIALILSSHLQAQELRYELGARLRMLEREFEKLTTAQQRAAALPTMSEAVRLFFSMKLPDAAQQIDATRIVLCPEGQRPLFERTVNLRLACSSRVLDPKQQTLDCTVGPLYGDTAWDDTVLSWRLVPLVVAQPISTIAGILPGGSEQQDSNLGVASGSLALSGPPPARFSIQIAELAPQDYLLQVSIGSDGQKASGEADGNVQLLQRIVSLVERPVQRVATLQESIDNMPDESFQNLHASSVRGNTRLLARILDGSSLETDFPAAQLLEQTERALQLVQAGKPAYGMSQPGQSWIVSGKGANERWLRVRAPKAASAGQPLPLVLALHGAGGSENMFFDTYGDGKVVRLSEERGWLLAAPRAGMGYSGYKLEQLVDWIDQLYPVDRRSVFVVGHSMGAGGAVTLTSAAKQKPTAVAALGGGRAIKETVGFEGVPVFVAAGSHDFGRAGAMQLADSLQAGGIQASYRDYENVEHLAMVQVALDDVFKFFDSHLPQIQAAPSIGQGLRINELQLVGTHNSYHLAPDSVAMRTIAALAPGEAKAIDNSQRPITDQLSQLGVRHIELDLFLDPEGKLFSKPLAYTQALRQQADVPEFDPEGKLNRPGIKVLHSPDFDFRTTAYSLIDALQEVKNWSDAHLQHVPIFVLLELKTDSFSPATRPLKWTLESFDELENEILSVFPRERILTPDVVRGDARTLRDAVAGQGWPTVDSQRGRVAFLLDNGGPIRDLYLTRSEILAGCLLFVSVDRQHPAAAWMKLNDAVRSHDEIQQLVQEGFMVRTRADVGTVEARRNDPRRRDLAISSGAQLISTDFPEPDLRFSDYHVSLPLPPE